MGYSYEVQSDTPGITFNDGFKSYDELPPCSDMLAKLDNGDYVDRHSCRSVKEITMDNKEPMLRVCPFCGGKAELIDETDYWYSKYSTDDDNILI